MSISTSPSNVNLLPHDIKIARGNWLEWRDVFEHPGPVTANPLLTSDARFRGFLKQYSVGRSIRRGRRDALQERLRAPSMRLADVLEDPSGLAVDLLDDGLRADFGTRGGTRSLRSGLSKIAAFLHPGTYIAWDKYARFGLNRVLGRAKTYQPATYRDYLGDVRDILEEQRGRIRSVVGESFPTDAARAGDRFLLRVLDNALMRIGGREY